MKRTAPTAAISAILVMKTQRTALEPGNTRAVAPVNIGDSRATSHVVAPKPHELRGNAVSSRGPLFMGPALALILATACSGGTPIGVQSASPVQGALAGGLIAYLGDQGVGVLDPTTGKSVLMAPLPAGGAFRASGPVWAPAPGVPYPVLYFTIHDDRPAESRTTPPGVIPYDWLFRADPFAGTVEPLAASADLQSEGPFGLVANARYLALTTGCCANYEVDALDLTRPSAGLKVLAKPPTQAALFTEGAAPGPDGLIAVRVV